MIDELKISLAVQKELLLFSSFLFFFLLSPLILEHVTLLFLSLSFLMPLNFSRILLPVKHRHGILYLLLLFASFLHFAFKLLLGIELPELRIDLFFHHLGLNFPSLVNQLLFPFDGRPMVVELLVLIP